MSAIAQRAKSLYLDGLDLRAVGRKIGRSHESVRQLLLAQGVAIRGRGGHASRSRPVTVPAARDDAPATPPPAPQKGRARGGPVHANASGNTKLRRFAAADIEPDRVVDLAPNHAAVVEGRTLFPSSVEASAASVKLLVSGQNNTKLGGEVLKGERAGWPIFHLTLEERATCPKDCAVWAGCYGNSMPFARRHRNDADLMRLIRGEVQAAAKMYPAGFLLRVHTLGDFFSVEYVLMWAELLATVPQLHVFGYTARREDSADLETRKIARAIRLLTDGMWRRFAIRTSHAEFGPQRSVVVMKDPEQADVIVCPAQKVKTEACATCGLCWAEAARGKTIAFLKHGMKRKGRREKAPDRQPEPAEPSANSPICKPAQETSTAADFVNKAEEAVSVFDYAGPKAPSSTGTWPEVWDKLVAEPLRATGPSPYDTAHPRPPPVRIAEIKPLRASAALPGRVERMRGVTGNMVRWTRAYLRRGVGLAFMAELFSVDAEALGRAVESSS